MVEILFRDQWGPTVGLSKAMLLPAEGVHVHHSVTVPDDVVADMQEIERIGIRRFGKFSYSYCGHPSGVVGEGAGVTVGAHTAGWNSTTLGFCFIGNYEVMHLHERQVQAFLEWRAWAVSGGLLRADHWIEPHFSRKATACPGRHVMDRWGALASPLTFSAPAPPEPPTPEDEDMPLLLQSTDGRRGFWLQWGGHLTYLGEKRTVQGYIDAGVKDVVVDEADFARMLSHAEADDRSDLRLAQLQDVSSQIKDLLAQLVANTAPTA